jgi:hypothetical protein
MLAPAALFAQAVATMNALPVPDRVTFDEVLTLDRGTLSIAPADNGHNALILGDGDAPATLRVRVIAAPGGDARVSIGDAPPATMSGVFFDPSWPGIAAFLRGRVAQNELFVPSAPLPSAAPSADGSAAPQTIASVAASPVYYDVRDAGARACPNGDPGAALDLRSRSQSREYPLTAVTIDQRNGRFCSMSFAVPAAFENYDAEAAYDVNFEQYGAYWLAGGGTVRFVATRPLHRTVRNTVAYERSNLVALP